MISGMSAKRQKLLVFTIQCTKKCCQYL